MPPRLNKRQQRELDELNALSRVAPQHSPGSDSDEGPLVSSGFAALVSPGDEDNDDEDVSQKSKKAKKKKKKPTAAKTSGVTPQPETPVQPSHPAPSKAEHKAAKKAKRKIAKAENTTDDIDAALAELSVKYPELRLGVSSSTTPALDRNQVLASLLTVSLSNLDADAEMRKFFGSKVVNASRTSSSSPGPRRRGAMQKSYLTRPPAAWWQTKSREGLTMRPLTNEEIVEKQGFKNQDDKWWTVEYSNRYKTITKRFIQTVASGNPDGFHNLLQLQPWHADTLLQLAEVYRHREEYANAVDLTERALFTYERSFLGTGFSFTTGTSRLDFDRAENRPFFLALHRQGVDLQRRGTPRTSFEFLRLLFSLDPWADPHGALLHLDYASIKGGMKEWLLGVYTFFSSHRDESQEKNVPARMDPSRLPGWNYSRALALFLQEKDSKSSHEESRAALKEALLSFPEMIVLLGDKAEVNIPENIRRHTACKVAVDGRDLKEEQAITHLLCHLYAQRATSLWKQPEVTTWFTETLASLASELPIAFPSSPVHELFGTETGFFSGNNNPLNNLRFSVYRHCITLESAPNMRQLLGFIPPSVIGHSGVAYDPLPPLTAKSSYNDKFFEGVTDELPRFRPTRRQREAEQRMLAQMVPDANFRRQMQLIYERMGDRFPGGILQFAQTIQQLPEDMIEDILLTLEGPPQHAGNDRGMPGGFADDAHEVALPDPEHLPEPQAVDLDDIRDSDDDDDEGEPDGDEFDGEDVQPFPVRVITNIFGRLFGGSGRTGAQPVSSSEDESDDLLDHEGVD